MKSTLINDKVITYITCCKLWIKFNETSNHFLLLRYKITDSLYYKLFNDFIFIQLVFNTLNAKTLLEQSDLDLIEKELIKYNDFFDIMSTINKTMNSD